MEYQSKIKIITDIIFTFLVGFIVFICVKFLLAYLLPFLIGIIVAWSVQKPARFFCLRLRIKRGIIAAVLSAVVFVVFAVFTVCVVYGSVMHLKDVIANLPQSIKAFFEISDRMKGIFDVVISDLPEGMVENFKGILTEMTEKTGATLADKLTGLIAFLVKKTPSFIFSFLVSLAASCYIAKDFEMLGRFIKGLMSKEKISKISELREIIFGSVLKIIKGYLILAIITFAELFLSFLILKVNNAFILALLISFIDLLPVFGTGAVLIPWGIAEALLGNSLGIKLIIVYVIIAVIRNLSEPKIVSSQIGIHPLFTLIAMVSGLKLLGFFGLIAFPLALIVTIKYYKNQMNEEEV